MKLDRLALIFVCIAAAGWGLMMFIGLLAAGPIGFLALLPMLVVGVLLGNVVSQRLNNKEDDYYDKVEK